MTFYSNPLQHPVYGKEISEIHNCYLLQVRLPDHDFVVGGRHNLIPSVYAVCDITLEGKVSYSGDTFIKIRSGKHGSSTAFTHHYDLTSLIDSGSIKRKPILVIGESNF